MEPHIKMPVAILLVLALALAMLLAVFIWAVLAHGRAFAEVKAQSPPQELPAQPPVRPAAQPAATFYDSHVFFDNSFAPGMHFYSTSELVAPSALETINGFCPVDTTRYVSPPNALRLKWKSAPGGNWQMVLRLPTRHARTFRFVGDSLVFQLHSDSEITVANAPLVYLLDSERHGTRSRLLVNDGESIPAGKWVQITLPFDSFEKPRFSADAHGTDDPKFTPAKLAAIAFVQGLDDNREHTFYLDDFQVRDRAQTPPQDSERQARKSKLLAPSIVAARGQERHVDLTWQRVDAPDVLSYRIYRCDDGGERYAPVGMQQNTYTRYSDFLGEPGRTAYYRISAIDLAGNESPLSESVKATTRAFNDDELLDMVQDACFRYYWEGGHPVAGLAPEVLPGDPNLIAVGGSGFGVMAIVAAAERQFISREQAAERLQKIVRFLARADRFHGAWPHFLDGNTGKTIPLFGKYDNGGDLVETAFMIQGLLVARQYFNRDTPAENEIRETITRLWHEVEWDWYRQKPDSPVLYWHWSPDHGFYIGHPLVGWNETLIVYLLAIASPTHPVPAELWHTGWAGAAPLNVRYRQTWSRTTDGDHFTNGNTYYGIKLEVGSGSGADLFFTHFSFMGFDPRNLRDRYTNYFKNNRAIALISRAYCTDNPRKFKGYGPDCWGLSAGINSGGGRAQPRDDNATINIMASLASFPYTPVESMAALKHFYRVLGAKTWGIYGFHDGFNETENWFEEAYMALNQAPITVMIENHRTGFIWKNFMANLEIKPALDAIGFHSDADSPPPR